MRFGAMEVDIQLTPLQPGEVRAAVLTPKHHGHPCWEVWWGPFRLFVERLECKPTSTQELL